MSFTPHYELETLDYGVAGWDAILTTDMEKLDDALYDLQGQIDTISGSDTFIGLQDTPSSYDNGKYIRSTTSGLEWATVSGAGVTSLIDLADCPSSYDDGKFLRSTSDGAVWATVSGAGGTSNHSELLQLSYAESGHTGFQPSGDYATNDDLVTASGNIVAQIPTDFYTTAEVDTISGSLHSEINAVDGDLDSHTGDASIHFTEASIDHSSITNLDYASAGHTGFASSEELTTVSGLIPTDFYTTGEVDGIVSGLQPAGDYATESEVTTISGNIVAQIPTDFYTQSEVDDRIAIASGTLQDEIDAIPGGVTDHSLLTNLDYASAGHTGFFSEVAGTTLSGILQDAIDLKYDKTGGFISGNVTIQGNLTVTGTEFISHVEEVEVDDNLLLINANETGGGVTKGWAGIEVDRGTETNYQFFFVEADQNFQVGISGSTQPVATRRDSADMDDNYVPYWDAANYRFDTAGSIAYDEIASTSDLATVSGVLQDEIDAIVPGISEVVDDTSPELGGDLSLNEHSITLNSSPTSDHTANGDIASMTVDANATGFGAALHMDTDGHWIEADADAETTMPCSAIALETGTGTKKVLLRGFIRDDSNNWTIGGLIYVSTTAGALIQTAPSGTGDQVQVVGFAVSADVMYFAPSYILSEIA